MLLIDDKTDGFVIQEIDKSIAVEFIHLYHYSKILPRITKFYIGIFSQGELVGIMTLGWGTQPLQTIQKIFYKHEIGTEDYLEIGKLCFSPKLNKSNYGSQIIAKILRWCRVNLNILFVYTLADGIMGKCGYIYQSANFKYLGHFKTQVYQDKVTGEKIHPRSAKSLLSENAEFADRDKMFWLDHEFCQHKGIDKITGLMFRYIYPLNNRARKILKCYPEYDKEYPKDKDLVFERRISKGQYVEIEQPDFNMDYFKYNHQNYNIEFVKEGLLRGAPRRR